MQPPPTRYTERNDVSIAYQVAGDGPVDLVVVPGFISHLDLQWTDPRYHGYLSRLSSFSRLIMYDKPGTGLSDPIAHLPTLEERAADLEAVLDAAGSEHAVLLGFSEGGPCAIYLAAARPERVTSLILCGSFATISADAFSTETVARYELITTKLEWGLDNWGHPDALEIFAPSISEIQKRFYATFARAAASPRMARALIDALANVDVREILGAITVPTLVLHLDDDQVAPVEAAQQLAAGIPDARLVLKPGRNHAFWLGDWEPLVDEMERFITGSVRVAEPDRVLATVVFTDIVGSTERAAAVGDQAWRNLLERHDALVAETITLHGGRLVKNIGDGTLSTFSGPARAVRCAQELCERVRELLDIEIRAGVHTGECEAIGDDLGGLAVHIGARVSAAASPGEVLVSGTVKDLVVGSGMSFADRGERELKGVPGTWRLYALLDQHAKPEPLDAAADHMRAADRVAVVLARRAPRALRFGARLVTRDT